MPKTFLSAENTLWITQFNREHRRKVRVLHIGNIANNAYINARLLNDNGFDCDVLCYDYYHSMGCPEWDEADFQGSIGDDFNPNWRQVDLCGFQRPRWFAQGPIEICVDYLTARRKARTFLASAHWVRLGLFNRTGRFLFVARAVALVWRLWTRLNAAFRRAASVSTGKAFRGIAKRLGFLVGVPIAAVASVPLALCFGAARKLILDPLYSEAEGESYERAFQRRCRTLVDQWQMEYPERDDKLSLDDLQGYQNVIPGLKRLFKNYDIIVGYSTDPILPLLADVSYFAFEHGTIRSIPYNPTIQGRLTALSYRMAVHIFVTNLDCRESASKLAPNRFTLINHPFDEERIVEDAGTARARLERQLNTNFLCFFPTRHDWVVGTGYADKANDMFFHAVAELKGDGIRVGVVCCSWGANIEETKSLLSELGIAEQVLWERPMATAKFQRHVRACDVVVDQFKLGAFGGIVYKSLAVGAAVLTYLNEKMTLEQYQVMPPIINCDSKKEISCQLRRLHRDRSLLQGYRLESQRWMREHHGKRSTINKQVDQYRFFLKSRDEVAFP